MHEFLVEAGTDSHRSREICNFLRAKELGEQLIVDIKLYRTHPNCPTLIYFVYDSEGQIINL
ncbi:hypothetical protein [Leptolyngbya sp. FACHB-711]|uniref:PD-(D/E)XK nuclease domain-containing protein n=1 Tax=Leptolyngbya sp. FACHB-711 TaxID=2692813 RepID=UPI0018EFAFA6